MATLQEDFSTLQICFEVMNEIREYKCLFFRRSMSSLVTCQVVEQAEGVGGMVAKVEFNSPERLNALTVDLAAGTTRTYTH